jgi:hypothetical protein
MAFFPVSPSDGEQANVGNITYQWSAAVGAWNRVGSTVNNFLVDGASLSITGNILCSGTGTSQFSNDLNVLGNFLVNGAATSQTITTGNVQAGNIAALTLTTNGALSAGSITTPGSIIANGQISTLSSLNSSIQVSAPLLTSSGNVVASGEIIGGGNIVVPGNISGQNITSTGSITSLNNISASANVTGGNVISIGAVSAVGNVSGTYILGNGAFLTGVVTGGGGGAGNRANVLVNTGSIANAATFTGTVTLAKGYAVYKVTTTDAAWVRLYSNAATQSSDSSRGQDTDPQPGSGVMVEAITNGANIVLISPAAVGWNDDDPVSNAIPISVTNLSGSPADIGVTFTFLGLET